MKTRIAYLLVAMNLIPLFGGAVRMLSVTGGTVPTPEDTRFLLAPLPVIVHIVCAFTYALIGAFQFDDRLRRAAPARHRRLGWLATVGGMLSAVSGLWMTLAYDIPVTMQGPLLAVVRVLVSSALAVSLVLAIVAIAGGDVRSHKAWMIRAYALGQGAGTQALLLLPPALLSGGHVTGLSRDLWMSAAWAINVLVAEWIIRRGSHPASAASQPLLTGPLASRASKVS